MKYLLMELPSFTIGLLLGVFGGPIFSESFFYFIAYLIFLFILYQGLTFIYVTTVHEELKSKTIIDTPNTIEEDFPTLEKELPIEEKETIPTTEYPKFKVLKDIGLSHLMINEKEIVCDINLEKKYVTIINLNNTKIDLFRFDTLIELEFIKKIN